MWTATVTETARETDQLRIRVEYVNGVTKFEELYYANSGANDSAWLKRTITDKVNRLTALDDLEGTITHGLVDTTPVIAIPPSQDDTDFNTFVTDYRVLQSMQKAIDAGFKKAADQDFIDLTAKVKSEYLDSYNGKF